MKLTDRIIGLESAYKFGKTYSADAQAVLLDELKYKLQDIEALWIQLGSVDSNWEEKIYFRYREYHSRLLKLWFLLEDTIRFIQRHSGPRIIDFICVEFRDLVKERILHDALFEQKMIDDGAVCLTVLVSYFQPEIVSLGAAKPTEVMESLHDSVNQLVGKYYTK